MRKAFEEFLAGGCTICPTKRAVTKAGLQGFRFHDQRHTFATRLVQFGGDLYAVKHMLGHKSIKKTERYAYHYPEKPETHGEGP